jgi:GTP cyclohydrolase I
MRSRGVEKQNSEMITSVMLGQFRKEPELREEFLSLLNKGGI